MGTHRGYIMGGDGTDMTLQKQVIFYFYYIYNKSLDSCTFACSSSTMFTAGFARSTNFRKSID